MRTERFNSVLLSTLIIVSLMVPAIMILSVSPTSASPTITIENIVRGKDTAYNIKNKDPAPWKEYALGDRPPLMVAARVESGAVVAAGFAPGCRDGDWNIPGNPDPHLPELLDATFQWMVPGATDVLWYGGYGVYNNTDTCGTLVAALADLGYTITGDSTMPITASLLASYDILIIPQLQLPYPPSNDYPSGNPDLLPDADVAAIKGFVEVGGGLLIMEATDFFVYKYSKVQNKILLALGFDVVFQDDSVYDDENNIAGAEYRAIVDVDPTTDIGAAYEDATGKTSIGLYGYCSLAEAGRGVSLSILPEFQVGMPGTTLEYKLKVSNPDNPAAENLTYYLSASDNAGWGPTIENTSLFVPKGEYRNTTLSVTIPTDASLGTEDSITVFVVASGYPEVQTSSICIANAAKRIEPTDDVYVDTADNFGNYNSENKLRIGRYFADWMYSYLQFDLSAIPPNADITDARLYLFAYYKYGPGFDVRCYAIESDAWTETTTTWANKPDPGAVLDTKLVNPADLDSPAPYFWDVTSFVVSEFDGDQKASFGIRPPDNLGESNSRAFWAKERYESRTHPFLRIIYTIAPQQYGVSVSISPSENNRPPGEDTTFTVTVTNEGNVEDTYSLTTADNASWTRSISPQTLSLAEGDSGTATLTVTIPSGAEHGTRDSITVTATSQTDDTVSDSASCTAQAVIARGVEVSISPTSGSGSLGEEVAFTVTVTNTGEAEDTYDITVSDNADWGATISPTSLTVPADGSQTTTVSVTIPSDAADGDSTRITVTATSRGDSTKSDSAACTATAEVAAEGFPIVYPVVAVVIIVVIIAVVMIRKPF